MSTIRVNAIQNTSGVEQYLCKAWVNFNGTGTVAIRASGNVSSITDNGTGDYTVNFTTAMADANYGFSASLGGSASDVPLCTFGNNAKAPNFQTSSVLIQTRSGASGTLVDPSFVGISIFR